MLQSAIKYLRCDLRSFVSWNGTSLSYFRAHARRSFFANSVSFVASFKQVAVNIFKMKVCFEEFFNAGTQISLDSSF